MPCNLAVTITKATALPEHLQKLLTPQVVKALVESFIRTHEVFKAYSGVQVRLVTGTVDVWLDWQHRITIYPGRGGRWQVRTDFPRNEIALAEQVTDLLTVLLSKGADRMYAMQIRSALQSFGKVEESQTKVRDGEQMVEVTLLKFEV